MPALAILLMAMSVSFDDKLEVTPGQAPDRGGFVSTVCPPAKLNAKNEIEKIAKAGGAKEDGGSPLDANVSNHGDGTKDYFMGEWKFVKGDRDLTVRQWCINKGTGSFISLGIEPSSKGEPLKDRAELPGARAY